MPNSIQYAQIFNQILDEIFYIRPRTMWMENTLPGLKWDNGQYIQIPKLTTPGLGTMASYKAPDGDLTLGYEQRYLQWYRGRNMTIGRYDVDMTNFALTVGNAMKVFLDAQVLPEVDKLRIMTAAKAAYNAGNITYYTPDASDVLSKLLTDIATVQNAIGEDKELYIQISTVVKNILMTSSQITKYLNTRDFTVRSLTTLVEALNNHPLIGTPSNYMQTAFDLNDGVTSGETGGGLIVDPLAQDVNWIICARETMDAVARPRVTKVIDPDINQDGEYWKIMFSIYHGAWAYDNKLNGIRASVNSSLGSLYVTSADAAAAGQTVITAAATSGGSAYAVPNGFGLYYKIDSDTAPTAAQGTALDSTWTLMTGNPQNIASTNGYKITVALAATGSLLPIASGNATIVIA